MATERSPSPGAYGGKRSEYEARDARMASGGGSAASAPIEQEPLSYERYDRAPADDYAPAGTAAYYDDYAGGAAGGYPADERDYYPPRPDQHRDAEYHRGGGGGGDYYGGHQRDYPPYRDSGYPRHPHRGGGGEYYRDEYGPPRERRYDDYYDAPPRRRYAHAPGPRHPPRPPVRYSYDNRMYHSVSYVCSGNEEERKKSTTLWVGNLPYNFKDEDVLDLFERFGAIVKVTVPIDRYTTKNKGFAFVQFESRRDAEDAYDHYYGTTIEGRRVRVYWDVGLNAKTGTGDVIMMMMDDADYG